MKNNKEREWWRNKEQRAVDGKKWARNGPVGGVRENGQKVNVSKLEGNGRIDRAKMDTKWRDNGWKMDGKVGGQRENGQKQQRTRAVKTFESQQRTTCTEIKKGGGWQCGNGRKMAEKMDELMASGKMDKKWRRYNWTKMDIVIRRKWTEYIMMERFGWQQWTQRWKYDKWRKDIKVNKNTAQRTIEPV